MITSLRIQRFKCFEDQTINFGNLTVLAGGNATGKSTVIQTMLLLWQSFSGVNIKQEDLLLYGDLVNIGTVLDAFKANSAEESIQFCITDETAADPVVLEFVYPINPESTSSMSKLGKPSSSENKLFKKQLIYFSAERVGPRLLYQVQDFSP